jgi:acyl dehydratase
MTMGFVFSSPDQAVAAIGHSLGESEWLTIDQNRIDAFADATGDHQWIHVDPDRAKSGPFGATIAHGYLTFSLINFFLPELFRGEGMKLAVNYGADRLRFPAPVPVGSRIRAVGQLVSAERLDGAAKPACVADILGRFYF